MRIQATIAIVLLLLAGCSGRSNKAPRPGIDPNPEGFPWGAPILHNQQPVSVGTDRTWIWVDLGGWPTCDLPPSPTARCINEAVIRAQLNRAVRICRDAGMNGILRPARVVIHPRLPRCGGGYGFCTSGDIITVPAYYVQWSGGVKHYATGIAHELSARVWGCVGFGR